VKIRLAFIECPIGRGESLCRFLHFWYIRRTIAPVLVGVKFNRRATFVETDSRRGAIDDPISHVGTIAKKANSVGVPRYRLKILRW